MQRKRKSKSEWLTVLASYKESGLNGSAFCRQEQICRKSFYNAKARYSTCTAESVVALPPITSQLVQVFGGKVNQNAQSDIEGSNCIKVRRPPQELAGLSLVSDAHNRLSTGLKLSGNG